MSEITQEQIEARNAALITAYLESLGLDASPGTAVHDLIADPSGKAVSMAETAFRTTLDNMDVRTASDEYARAILSNFGLKEQSSGSGTGTIMLLTEADELVVRRNTVFIAGGTAINLSRDYIGSVDISGMSPDVYVPLLKYDDQLNYMLITGTTVGEMTVPLIPGTELTADPEPSGLESARVMSLFVSVQTARTLDDLRGMIDQGLPSKTMAGPAHIRALLTESDKVAVLDASVVGMNDPEMLRDTANLYGASSGGHVDIYVKTGPYVTVTEVLRKATRLGGASSDRYGLLIEKDDAPGFYYVQSVAYDQGEKMQDISGFSYYFGADTTGAVKKPSFPLPRDARYSAFQNCYIEFEYPGVPEGETEPEFTLELVSMPGLSAVQDLISDPDVATPAADCVAKAAVPMFLSVEVRLAYPVSGTRPDDALIAQTVADKVNSLPMGRGFLSGAEIAEAITEALPDTVVKLPVVMEAFTMDNEGAFMRVRSTDTLVVPSLPERGISGATTVFLCSPLDVSVSVYGEKL